MTRLKDAGTLLALLRLSHDKRLGICGKSAGDSAQSAASNAGQAVDNSMNKVGDFMDDSTITAR
jgi:hyperosmotically inducible protein